MTGAVELVLYEAPGCTLCVHAGAAADGVAARTGVALRRVDISGDDELERRYRLDIPVVEVDGQRVAALVVEPSRLEAAVTAAQARRSAASS